MEEPVTQQSAEPPPSVDGCRVLGRVTRMNARGGMVQLTATVPGWVPAKAGQFALLQAESSRCFLSRALSVSSQKGEKVSFVVAPIGEGTQELCALEKGSGLWVHGPLGSGYDLAALTGGQGRVVIVGGGVGLAPFPLLVDGLAAYRSSSASVSFGGKAVSQNVCSDGASDKEVMVWLGFRDAEQAEGAEWLQEALARSEQAGLRASMEIATEDGSRGMRGKVTDLLRRKLRPGDRLAVCGPVAMAKEVWRLCLGSDDVKAWFSLEANMACGVGSCHGCVTALTDGTYARVCREGPVFSGEGVFGG